MNDYDRMAADAIIERIADGEATEQDWSSFRALAGVEPSLWQDLAEAQRLHAAFTSQVRAALDVSDRVEAPMHAHMTEGLTRRIRAVGAWGGWLAAAGLALAWGTGTMGAKQAGLVSLPSSADQALEQYLAQGQKSGRVMGELPNKLIVESRPSATGNGCEVIYVRQILERRVMTLYEVGMDDSGSRAVPVEATPLPAKPM